MTSSFLGGIMTPPPPRHHSSLFGYPPFPCARDSRQNWFRDKTAYVGLLTIVESPSQPGTASPATLSVTVPSFVVTKHISSEDLIKDDWKIYIKALSSLTYPHPSGDDVIYERPLTRRWQWCWRWHCWALYSIDLVGQDSVIHMQCRQKR